MSHRQAWGKPPTPAALRNGTIRRPRYTIEARGSMGGLTLHLDEEATHVLVEVLAGDDVHYSLPKHLLMDMDVLRTYWDAGLRQRLNRLHPDRKLYAHRNWAAFALGGHRYGDIGKVK